MEQRFKDKKAPYKVLELDQEYTDLKSRVTKYERRILKELGFCVHARHPHKFMITMLQSLGLIRNWRLCQAAWSYMNDALKTHVFVRHLPEVVSCACVQMACDLVQVSLPMKDQGCKYDWHELYDATKEDIEEVSDQITKAYHRRQNLDPAKLYEVVTAIKRKNNPPTPPPPISITPPKQEEKDKEERKRSRDESRDESRHRRKRSRSDSRDRKHSRRRRSRSHSARRKSSHKHHKSRRGHRSESRDESRHRDESR